MKQKQTMNAAAIHLNISLSYKEVQTAGQDLVIAIVGIAKDSAGFVQSAASKIPIKKVIEFVASDIQGAFTAAETSAKFPPKVRVACIIAGAL